MRPFSVPGGLPHGRRELPTSAKPNGVARRTPRKHSRHDPVTAQKRPRHVGDVHRCHRPRRGYADAMPHDAPARKLVGVRVARGGAPARGRYWWLRWAVVVVVAAVLGVEVALGWDQLAKAWMSLYEAK